MPTTDKQYRKHAGLELKSRTVVSRTIRRQGRVFRILFIRTHDRGLTGADGFRIRLYDYVCQYTAYTRARVIKICRFAGLSCTSSEIWTNWRTRRTRNTRESRRSRRRWPKVITHTHHINNNIIVGVSLGLLDRNTFSNVEWPFNSHFKYKLYLHVFCWVYNSCNLYELMIQI